MEIPEIPDFEAVSQTLKRSFQELFDNLSKDSCPSSKRSNLSEEPTNIVRVEVSKVNKPSKPPLLPPPPPPPPKQTNSENPRTDIIRVEISKVI